MEQSEWEHLSPEQKKKQLYIQQCQLLEKFREHHAIDEAQYNKSLHDLTVKMGMA